MLTDIIPAKWRKIVYALYALVTLAEGAMLTAYTTIQAPVPSWLLVSMAVTVYVGVPLGAVAASNVTVPLPARAVTPAAVAAPPVAVTPAPTVDASGAATVS